jgi:hypothetical protein
VAAEIYIIIFYVPNIIDTSKGDCIMKNKKPFFLANPKWKLYIVVLIIITAVSAYTLKNMYYFFTPSPSKYDNAVIGVIDDTLSENHPCLHMKNNTILNESSSHGDSILDFLDNCGLSDQVFYYDATNNEGKITSSNILDGLQWLKTQGVEYINISLSSKNYSTEIQEWITDNADAVTVFASYNNIYQSSDYPAMYSNVVGSGTHKKIMDLSKDCAYTTYKIINTKKLSLYNGNSYLSLVTMLDLIEERNKK